MIAPSAGPIAGLSPLRDPGDPSTWSVARHEAGHAVVAAAFDLDFRYVTLRPRDPRYRGVLVGLDVSRPLPAIAVSIAGCAAVFAADTSADLADLYCGSGRIDINNILRRGDGLPSASLRQIAGRTAWILGDTHREAVDAVAEALVHHPEQTLTHRQVVDLVEDNGPTGLTWLLRRSSEHLALLENR